jgi:tetratricopeptide (TPR) repeat protein
VTLSDGANVIAILMALAAAAGPAQPAPLPIGRAHAAAPSTSRAAADPREQHCLDLVRTAPEQAVQTATAWRSGGGGIPALLCQGLAYTALERWPEAATAFENAAQAAERAQDRRRANFWVESGNSWLAGGDPAKARRAFDTALAACVLTPQMRGEIHLDRARASVASGDVAGARVDLDRGLALVPADPFAWYLSAALARRQNDLPRARTDIDKAVTLAPEDAAVLLEAGNIFGLTGDVDAAKTYYQRAVRAGAGSPAGMSAASALAANGGPAQVPVTSR